MKKSKLCHDVVIPRHPLRYHEVDGGNAVEQDSILLQAPPTLAVGSLLELFFLREPNAVSGEAGDEPDVVAVIEGGDFNG